MAKWNLGDKLDNALKDEPKRKLFLMTRVPTGKSYDVIRSMVVRAYDESEARQEAAMKSMDEGVVTWLDMNKSYCQEIEIDGDAQVICVDAIYG